MGTNYYARFNECDHCGRYDEAHIGKALRTVRVYPVTSTSEGGVPGTNHVVVSCFEDWRGVLMDGPNPPTVWDEYGDQITDVQDWLDEWQPEPGHKLYDVGDFIDAQGYYCIPSEFC